MKRHIIKGDITEMEVDCIVNAANSTLLGGGGVDGAIHAKAGRGLLKECKTLGGCKTGEAKITKGYKLKAKYVIHTVGAIYSIIDPHKSARELISCYYNCLELAKQNDIHSIAFPSISTGAYGYPIKEATKLALGTTQIWAIFNPDYDIDIYFVCYDNITYKTYTEYNNIFYIGE